MQIFSAKVLGKFYVIWNQSYTLADSITNLLTEINYMFSFTGVFYIIPTTAIWDFWIMHGMIIILRTGGALPKREFYWLKHKNLLGLMRDIYYQTNFNDPSEPGFSWFKKFLCFQTFNIGMKMEVRCVWHVRDVKRGTCWDHSKNLEICAHVTTGLRK